MTVPLPKGKFKPNVSTIIQQIGFYGIVSLICYFPVYNSYASAGIGFALFSLCAFFISGLGRSTFRPSCPPVYVFIFICALSVIRSTDLAESMLGSRKLALSFFVCLSIVNFARRMERLKFLTSCLVATAGIVALDGLYQAATGQDWFSARLPLAYPHLGLTRITASFRESGSLGIFLGAIIPIAFSFTLSLYKESKRILAAALCILLIFALILTFAPGAALGLVTASLVISIIRRIRWLPIVIVAGVILGAFFLPESLTSWPNGSFFQTIRGRLILWQAALDMLAAHPLFGMGLRTFGLNYQGMCHLGDPHCGGGAPYAHSMYFQMAAEIGLLGLLAFFFFISDIFKKLITVYKNSEDVFYKSLSLGLIGSFSAYLTHGLLESSLSTSQGGLLFWILTGLTLSLHNLQRKERDKYPDQPPGDGINSDNKLCREKRSITCVVIYF